VNEPASDQKTAPLTKKNAGANCGFIRPLNVLLPPQKPEMILSLVKPVVKPEFHRL
jgi:hypothetical protein